MTEIEKAALALWYWCTMGVEPTQMTKAINLDRLEGALAQARGSAQRMSSLSHRASCV